MMPALLCRWVIFNLNRPLWATRTIVAIEPLCGLYLLYRTWINAVNLRQQFFCFFNIVGNTHSGAVM